MGVYRVVWRAVRRNPGTYKAEETVSLPFGPRVLSLAKPLTRDMTVSGHWHFVQYLHVLPCVTEHFLSCCLGVLIHCGGVGNVCSIHDRERNENDREEGC